MMQEQQGAASAAVNETAQTMPSPDNPAAHATVEHGVSSQDAVSMPPIARRESAARTHHGDTFLDPYAWMRDKDSAEVRDYVTAQNAYGERRTAALGPLRDTLFNELTSRIQQTDMSVPTRMDGYWYFTRTREGSQYAVQCRLPIRGEGDWTPPDIDPLSEPGSMPCEQVVFDTNREAEGHDFFQIGGMDLSRDGRWMLYGVDTRGDERYDFRIRDLQSGTELPEVLEGIAGACITPDAQWVFYTVLDDAWRPCAVRRHKVGTPVSDDVEVFREHDERFWLGVGLSFDERNIVIGTGSKTTTEVLMLPADTPEGEFRAFIPREPDIEYDVSFARFEDAGEDGADIPLAVVYHNAFNPNFEIDVIDMRLHERGRMHRAGLAVRMRAGGPRRARGLGQADRHRLPQPLEPGDPAGGARPGHRGHRPSPALCGAQLPGGRHDASGRHDQAGRRRGLPGRPAVAVPRVAAARARRRLGCPWFRGLGLRFWCCGLQFR